MTAMKSSRGFAETVAIHSNFKFDSGQSRLANDGLQGANFDFGVIGYWNGHCGVVETQLHHNMATTLPNFNETISRKDCADLLTRENAEFTQLQPQVA